MYNMCIYNLLLFVSKKFACTGDLALLHTLNYRKKLKEILRQDITTLSQYLYTWRLKLSHLKTGTTAFHINNREAKRELAVYNNNSLPFSTVPI